MLQVCELYDNGCRVAALRVYNNSRALTDRALLLVPAWLSRTSPSSPTAAAFAAGGRPCSRPRALKRCQYAKAKVSPRTSSVARSCRFAPVSFAAQIIPARTLHNRWPRVRLIPHPANPILPRAVPAAVVMSRHLNKICRHVLLPGQLARASQDLADLVPCLQSAHDRLIAYVTATRAHIHLMALQPAAQHLAAADELAQQLYPALAALVEAIKAAAQPRAKTTGGVGADAGNAAVGGTSKSEDAGGGSKPSARIISVSTGGGGVQTRGAKDKLDLSGIPREVRWGVERTES